MNNEIPKPNFFIIGAPRCGTTAMSEYLRQHPQIGFADPKESSFFATDMPELCLVGTMKDYLSKHFAHCAEKHYLAIGDGSVWHLYSKVAVQNILQFNPQARFIIMIRNPIELCRALYERQFELFWEDQPSFERAWRLQAKRSRGLRVPRLCRDSRLLLYGDIGKLGEQLERVYKLIAAHQRLVIVFDDFARDPAAAYAQVLTFLQVPHDGRQDFPKVNEGRHVWNRNLLELATYPPVWAVSMVTRAKSWLGIQKVNILPKIRARLISPRHKKQDISEQLKHEMRTYFAEDIDRLSAILNRDLSHWKCRPNESDTRQSSL
jgi:sulfotransferase family protein